MVYYLLYKSDIFNKDEGFNRDVKIIVFGTIIYILLKYIFSSIFGINGFLLRIVYYIGLIDMIYCYYNKEKFSKKTKKKNIKGNFKKELNGLDSLRRMFEKQGLDVLESLKEKLNSEKNNLSYKVINEPNNIFINKDIPINTQLEIKEINEEKNFEVVNNDNLSLESDNQSIQIPIYVSSKKELSLNTTEIDTDSESDYIPIYRSRKKSLKNNNNYN